MGSAVSITPDLSQEAALHKLLADAKKLKNLFDKIASTVEEGRINLQDKISVNNLVLYTKNAPAGDFIKLMGTDVSVLLEAHKVACGKIHPDQLPFKRFTIFLETLFLFSHLWKFFVLADCVAIDRKIQKGEFIYAKSLVKGIEGFNVANVDDEVWGKEFENIDRNKNGNISFKELCLFTMKNVCTSEAFAHYQAEESNAEPNAIQGSVKLSKVVASLLLSSSSNSSSSSSYAAITNFHDSHHKSVYVSALEAVLAEEERLRRIEEQCVSSQKPIKNVSSEEKGEKKIRMLLLGLNNAGKTSILNRLQGIGDLQTVPTQNFNCEDVRFKDTLFEVWDLGGGRDARAQWPNYYADSECILFVVDSSEKDQLVSASAVMQETLAVEELQRAPLLVFANKSDCAGALSSDEVSSALLLPTLTTRPWKTVQSCAVTGTGLDEGLDWLLSVMK